MIFGFDETLEDLLPQILLEETSAKQLLQHAQIKKRGVTIQALYKALRKLAAQNIILKHKKYFVVSKEWLERVRTFSTQASGYLPEAGNKVTLTFSNFAQVDAYWKHVALNLPEGKADEPFFAYLPHNFWIHNPDRFLSELAYYESFEKNKQHGYMVIGGDKAEDLTTKKKLASSFLHVNTLPYAAFRRTDHIAIMGPFITTTRLSVPMAKMIDVLYAKYEGRELLARLEKAFHQKTSIKIILEHAPGKAADLRKKLSKDFYIVY